MRLRHNETVSWRQAFEYGGIPNIYMEDTVYIHYINTVQVIRTFLLSSVRKVDSISLHALIAATTLYFLLKSSRDRVSLTTSCINCTARQYWLSLTYIHLIFFRIWIECLAKQVGNLVFKLHLLIDFLEHTQAIEVDVPHKENFVLYKFSFLVFQWVLLVLENFCWLLSPCGSTLRQWPSPVPKFPAACLQ